LSEGGLAVAVAEMAFAGGLGAQLRLSEVPSDVSTRELADPVILFSESNSRFLCEVAPPHVARFEEALAQVPHAAVGEVTATGILEIIGIHNPAPVVEAPLQELKDDWQAPLRWN
jgi:phosphoribosylformylglycinamidine synthase